MPIHDTVSVVGTIWMPAVKAATEYSLTSYDVRNMTDDDGNITRDSVQSWLDSHAGDFQSVDDFSATIGGGVIPWADEENEILFGDLMFSEEDY